MTANPKKILVIDDDRIVRNSFVLSLEEMNYDITACERADQGLAAFAAGHYDLVYLDLKMPGKNGVEALREIRELDAEVPVYIVTAYFGDFAKELNQIRADNLDFEVLIKPLGREQIIEITRNILEGPRLAK